MTYQPMGDLLPWSSMPDVERGLMRTKDDGLLCTYEVVPYDLGSLSEAEQGSIMHRINETFKRLDEGWAVWVHARRTPYTDYSDATWPHAGAAILDDERRAQLMAAPGRWTTHISLTLWHGPVKTTRRLIRAFFFEDDRTKPHRSSRLYEPFEADVERTMGVLSGAVIDEPIRHDGDALCRYLRRFVSISDHMIVTPDIPVDLAYTLSDDCGFWPGIRPMLGNQEMQQHLRVLSLSEDIPDVLWSAMFRHLYRLPFAYDWVTRWIPMNREKARSLTTKKQINWLSKQKGWLAGLHERITGQPTEALDSHMKKQAKDADAARNQMLSDESSLGYLSSTFLVRRVDAAEAERDIRTLQTMIQTQGCICIDEDLGATEAIRGSWPGNVHIGPRRHILKTMNFAHVGPWTRPWGGIQRNAHLKGPPLMQAITEGCMPFGIDPFVGDLGDTLTIGPKGSGKSTLSAFMDIAQWLRYRDAQVIAWDVGGSWRAITLFLHGMYHDLAAGQSYIQVLHHVDTDEELPWLLGWLVARVKEKNVLITPEVEKIISGGVRHLRENTRLPRRMGSLLMMFNDHLRHVDMSSNSKIDANGMSRRDTRLDTLVMLIRQVHAALADWAEGGKFGHLADAPEDRLDWARINTFELRSLLALPNAYPGMLEVIQHRMEPRLDGRPTRLLFGEPWAYFSNPTHLEVLRTSIPHWRRDNASANFSPQSIAQLIGTPLTAFLLESCQCRLYLPNPQALSGQVRPLYEDMELHEDEIRDNIATATPKRDVYVVRPDGRRLVNVELGPIARMVCGSNSQEDHALFDDLLAKHGTEEFPYQLLKAHGFHEQAARLLVQPMAADD